MLFFRHKTFLHATKKKMLFSLQKKQTTFRARKNFKLTAVADVVDYGAIKIPISILRRQKFSAQVSSHR